MPSEQHARVEFTRSIMVPGITGYIYPPYDPLFPGYDVAYTYPGGWLPVGEPWIDILDRWPYPNDTNYAFWSYFWYIGKYTVYKQAGDEIWYSGSPTAKDRWYMNDCIIAYNETTDQLYAYHWRSYPELYRSPDNVSTTYITGYNTMHFFLYSGPKWIWHAQSQYYIGDSCSTFYIIYNP